MRYTKKHDGLKVDGNDFAVSIAEFATGQLGDIVSLEPPELGKLMTANDDVVVIEGIKAAGEISAVYHGEIVAAYEALVGQPNPVNEDSDGSVCFF